MIYARALGEALRTCLRDDPRVLLLGEDIADPYGGAFKVTRGLTTEFPDRVRSTPISEAAITGLAAGLALSGYRPIVEIMFGDFLSLTFDQLVNHVTKYGAMYDDVSCPVVVRTPSGGGRGYGPTHSQSLEKHFLGMPHLRIVAASLFHDPGPLLRSLLQQPDPVLFVEHKLLYPQHLLGHSDDAERADMLIGTVTGTSGLPTTTFSAVPREDCTVTLVAYGQAAAMAARLVERLAIDDEIFVELIVPSQIDPPDEEPIDESVAATGALVTAEEGTSGWSWGTGIAEQMSRRHFGRLRHPAAVVASERDVIPAAKHLEERMLVSPLTMERAVREAA
jgi:pyruvate/2-oxoglutarate/acetoin dehydrogenase E1 component